MRVGIVRYTNSVARDPASLAIFKLLGIIPLHLDYDGWDDSYTLKGTSHMFDEINAGEVVPEYLIIVHKAGDGKISINVKRVDK